jgi:HAD superfamily hydrolase (TIGR01509 family)
MTMRILDEFDPQALIFDFDGTLADSMWVWEDILRDLLVSRRLELDEELYDSFLMMGLGEFAEYLTGRFTLEESVDELVEAVLTQALCHYRTDVCFKPGAREFLEEAARRGLPLGIATSSPRVLIEAFLEAQQATRLFSALSFCDELGTGKARPDVYLDAARQLGAPIGRCLIFEDAIPSLRTASRTGARTIAVREAHTRQDEREMVRIADAIIDDYGDLCPTHHPLSRCAMDGRAKEEMGEG